MKDLLSTGEVAQITGLSHGRIRQLIVAKRLPAEKIGGINVVRKENLALLENRKHGRPKKEKAA